MTQREQVKMLCCPICNALNIFAIASDFVVVYTKLKENGIEQRTIICLVCSCFLLFLNENLHF
jgi:hypothetical protein